jgi:NAD(P)H dehydrogenase (quinone)
MRCTKSGLQAHPPLTVLFSTLIYEDQHHLTSVPNQSGAWEHRNLASPSARQFGSLHKDIVSLGIPCTFLECGYFMQNLMGSAGAIKAGVLPVTTGKGKFCPVDIEDIGAVAAQVLVEDASIHTGKIYTITGPEALNGDDMAAIFSKVLGKPIKVDMWDQKKTGEMYKSFGVPDWQLPGMLELMHVFEQGWAGTPALDVNKIVWHHTTLEQFIIRNKSAFT